MKRFLVIILVLMAGLSSCYRDKGNYSYENINRLEIDIPKGKGNWTVAIGDTIQITPRFKFEADSVEDHLTYEWKFLGRVLSTERNLFYIADAIGAGVLSLYVTDIRTGVVYLEDAHADIRPEFEVEGWVVLSDNGGSMLSYFRNTSKLDEKEEKWLYDCKDYIDVYQTINHEALGGKPKKLLEHFVPTDWDTFKKRGNFWIIQEGGIGTVDVGVSTFEKETTLPEQFINGVYPDGFEPALMAGGRWFTLVVGEDGKMYSRKKVDIYQYNSGLFIPSPMKLPDGRVVDGRGVINAPVADTYGLLVCDRTNKCFVAINDNDEKISGEIGLVRVDEKLYAAHPNFARLDDLSGYEIVYNGYVNSSSGFEYFTILKDEATGEYYSHRFCAGDGWDGKLMMVSEIIGQEKMNIKRLIIDENTVFNATRRTNYVWISQGNELWYYNRITGVLDKFYTSFSGDITAMDSESYVYRLGVGLVNGEFHVLDVSPTIVGDEVYDPAKDKNKVLYSSPKEKNLGRVVDIRYKTQGASSWQFDVW